MKVAEESRQLLAALGRVPSGLFVLTLARNGLETGMLASWVQQCSFDPPMVSVAVRQGREMAGLLTADSLFTLNVLDDSQTDMIAHFGKGFCLGEPAFIDLEVLPNDGGGPILAEALAFLNARVAGQFAAGDHNLVAAQVVGGRVLSEGHPMVHIRKSGSHY